MSDRTRKIRTDKWEPSNDDIAKIETLAGHGLPIEQIASLIDVSKATLDRHKKENSIIAEAILRGRSKAAYKVSETAYKMAVSGKQPGMTTFWLRCRAGWSEDQGEQPNDFEEPELEESLRVQPEAD